MDVNYFPKGPPDPNNPNSVRRHTHPHPPVLPPLTVAIPITPTTPSPKPPHFKPSPCEALFRLLCPAAKARALIGKDGAAIRHLRQITAAKIHIDDTFHHPSCEERVIFIVADRTRETAANTDINNSGSNREESNNSSASEEENSSASPLASASVAQNALLKVFERIVRGEEEESNSGSSGEHETAVKGLVACRLLAPSNLVGCVLGRGGKIVEKIRNESGAQIRVLSREQLPACAFPGDELIQMTGNFVAVKKALLFVSSCLQDNPRTDAISPAASRTSNFGLYGSGSEGIGAYYKVSEEEVVFKLLCPADKVGSLIGKGGSSVRAIQNETGASIKIADPMPDSDERVVVIYARENSEQFHSPSQDAVIRVLRRLAEIGFEPGATVFARLLVRVQQIGCLLGKGGFIINELRRATGACIRILPKDQVPKFGFQNEEVIQITGSLQTVQDALFHITNRLREIFFPMKPSFSGSCGPPNYPPFPEMHSPQFRPRHNPASPGQYPSPHQPHDHHPAFFHGRDRFGPSNMNRVPYPHGSEHSGHGPTYDRSSSPRSWAPPAAGCGPPRGNSDIGFDLVPRSSPLGSSSQANASTSATVEVVIPQTLMPYIYGEKNSNLSYIRQISGANIVAHDPKAGASEGVVIVSGTPDQRHAAQSLIQAFIFCGRAGQTS